MPAPTTTQLNARNMAVGAPATASGELSPGTMPVTPAPSTKAADATEPSVVSSGTITDSVIPTNKTDLASLQQKGTYVGQDGNTYYQDGSMAWAGTTGEPAPQIDNPDNDPDIAHINQSLGGMKALTDATTKTNLDSVHSAFARRIAMQTDINQRTGQTRAHALLTGGASRYAPLNSRGIMTAQERSSLAAVSKLEGDEEVVLNKAKAAQAKGDQQEMNNALTEVKSIRAAKLTAATAAQKLVDTNNTKVQTQHTQALRDETIAEEVARGTTDPAKIMANLNATEGNNFSLKEINAALGDLKPKTSSTDLYKFSTPNVGKMLASGISPDQVRGVADDLNGRGDGSTLKDLTPAQQKLVEGILAPQKVSNAKPKVSGSLSYTPETVQGLKNWLTDARSYETPQGNFVPENAYAQALQSWKNDGGSSTDFLKMFPQEDWLATSEQKPEYSTKKTSSSSSSGRTL